MTPDRFRECLDLLRWTQRGLAEALQCDDRLVRRWASGGAEVPSSVSTWLDYLARIHAKNPPPAAIEWRRRAYEQNGVSQMHNYMLIGIHDGAVMALGGVMAKDDADAKQKAAEEIKDKLDRMDIAWNATISITRPNGSALPGISAIDLAKLA